MNFKESDFSKNLDFGLNFDLSAGFSNNNNQNKNRKPSPIKRNRFGKNNKNFIFFLLIKKYFNHFIFLLYNKI